MQISVAVADQTLLVSSGNLSRQTPTTWTLPCCTETLEHLAIFPDRHRPLASLETLPCCTAEKSTWVWKKTLLVHIVEHKWRKHLCSTETLLLHIELEFVEHRTQTQSRVVQKSIQTEHSTWIARKPPASNICSCSLKPCLWTSNWGSIEFVSVLHSIVKAKSYFSSCAVYVIDPPDTQGQESHEKPRKKKLVSPLLAFEGWDTHVMCLVPKPAI